MTNRITVSIYAITLILSAFLLFSVQPYFARLVLPLLGGSPSVWNTAMVFFQAMLLAGYAYAHGTSHFLNIRAQAALHMVLLIGFAAFLPLALPAGLHPPTEGQPALWQLSVMAMVVGAPFFIVSASAPMFQRWFSNSDHKDSANPYFLYAASNIGSMAALLSYPVVIEPLMTLKMQSLVWAGGYGVLVALSILCALLVWKKKGPAQSMGPQTGEMARPAFKDKILWLVLAFIPSSLLLGVTTYITTDIASVPLFWIVPLALYLATFILVFARRPLLNTRGCIILYSTLFIFAAFIMTTSIFNKKDLFFALHLTLFFSAALLCHKKLADLRPPASHLTSFYMYMSLGGVLGGLFNALLAPVIFSTPIEYTLALCAVLCVRTYIMKDAYPLLQRLPMMQLLKSPSLWLAIFSFIFIFVGWNDLRSSVHIYTAAIVGLALIAMRRQPLAFAAFGCIILLLHSPLTMALESKHILTERNFFGVLRVTDSADGQVRSFLHGTTLHGAQPKSPVHRLTPLTYYHPLGPLGDVFRILDDQSGPQEVGAIGLGVGTIACYAHPGRSFDFYEIDPAVVRIAEDKTYFTYLSDCGSPYSVTLGDGRLTLKSAPEGKYDVLILDAFSSDNIPMHVVTLEAFEGYMQKVKPNGMIVFNISNRFLDLEPQLAAISAVTKVPSVIKFSSSNPIAAESPIRYAASNYVVFTPNPDTLMQLRGADGWEPTALKPGFRIWTDDYANIIAAFHRFK